MFRSNLIILKDYSYGFIFNSYTILCVLLGVGGQGF